MTSSLRRRMQQSTNPAGGLFFHYLALKYRKRLWATFATQIAVWLEEWNPHESEIILIGCSAGYTLPTPFLRRFQRITAFDPDPFAKPLFHLLHRDLLVQFRFDRDPLEPNGLNAILAEYPDAAVLFCNVLGQRAHLNPKIPSSAYFESIKENLSNRSWASFHDILSSKTRPTKFGFKNIFLNVTEPTSALDIESIASSYWNEANLCALIDHETMGLHFTHHLPVTLWSLHPNAYHLTGFVAQNAKAPSNIATTRSSDLER